MQFLTTKSKEDAYSIAFRFFKMILDEINFHSHSSKYLTSDEFKQLTQYYSAWTRGKDEYFGHYFAQRLKTAIKILLNSAPEPIVLDCGSGLGSESILFGLLGAKVLGIDLSAERAAIAVKRLRYYEDLFSLEQKVHFRNMNLLDYKAVESFDLIYAKESITHVYSVPKLVNFVKSILKSNGHLIISDANPFNPLVSYKAWKAHKNELYVTVVNPETGSDVPYAVERLVSPFYLESLLRQMNFKSISHFYGSPPLPRTLVPFLKIFENKVKFPVLALYEIVSKKC